MTRFTTTNYRKWWNTYQSVAAKKGRKAEALRLKIAKYLARLNERTPAIINKEPLSEKDFERIDPGKYFTG